MGSLAKDPGFAGHIAGVTKALGHPTRLRIVALLCEGDMHVGSLAEALGSPQAIVSQQLRILRMSGLVSVARVDGNKLTIAFEKAGEKKVVDSFVTRA